MQRLKAGKYIQDDEDIEHLLTAIRESDAISRAHESAAAFARRAEDFILDFAATPERDALVDMTRFIVERKK